MSFRHLSKAQTRVVETPLTSEKLKVYGDFLDAFSSLHFSRLANQTAPFLPADLPQGSACAQGIDLEDQSNARGPLHRFGPEITKGRELFLVDPSEQAKLLQTTEVALKRDTTKENTAKLAETLASDYGFVALSEIIFDKSHHFAVLKYLYFCGSHCKHGGTLVMEKVGSSWTAKTRRPCTMIVN